MISVCQIYNDFKGENNTWQQGHFRPQSFEFSLHMAQMEVFNKLRMEWEKSQVVSDNLRPFFKSVQISIKDYPKGGMIEYPADYSMYSSLRYFSRSRSGGAGVNVACIEVLDKGSICRPLREEEKTAALSMDELYEHPIDKIDNQRWGAASQHQFIPLDINNPGCTQYNEGFKVLPKKIGVVVLDYLAIPERPKFNYHKDAKHNILCDKCTDLLWGEEVLPEIMSRLKTRYGSYTSNQVKYEEGTRETKLVGS